MIFKESQRLISRSSAIAVLAALFLCLLLSSLWSPARAASPGTVAYNRDQRMLIYNNGMINIGVGAGASGYLPLSVRMDGVNDGATRSTDWTGLADGNIVTGSFWFRRTGNFNSAAAPNYIYNETGSKGLQIWFNTSNQLSIQGKNSAATVKILQDTNTQITDSNWHHVVFSFDTRNTTTKYIYLDDALDMASGAGACGGSNCVWSNSAPNAIAFSGNAPLGIFCNSTCVAADRAALDVADFWLDFNTYMDLSVAANRRKFINASLQPVFLGADGSLPTGQSPIIFFSGYYDNRFLSTNHGTGGSPDTIDGALSVAPYGPAGAPLTVTRAAELTGGNMNMSSGLAVNGNYAYVVNNGSPGVFQVVDITNPAAPTVSGMGSVSNASFADVTSYGDQIKMWNHYALVTEIGQVIAVDISNPASPSIAATLTDATNICPTSPCAIGMYNNYLYITSPNSGSAILTVVKIADDTTPTTLNMRVVSANPGEYDFNDIAIDSVNAYLYGGSISTYHLVVVSLQYPDAPNVVKSFANGTFLGNVGGGLLAGMALNPKDSTVLGIGRTTQEFVVLVDVTTPSAPVVIGKYQLGVTGDTASSNDGYAQGVRAYGNRVYVSSDVSGLPALTVSDIANSASPPQLLGFSGLAAGQLCTNCHHMAQDASGNYVLMTETASGKGLVSYNIADGGTCSSPTASEGTVLYNNASHVLQYCNGSAWSALGPVPGAGGSGCSGTGSPAEGSMGVGQTAGSDVLQYCDGTNWVQLGGSIVPTSGLAGYWKFDTEACCTTTPDSSGNGNSGTLGTLTHAPAQTASAHDGSDALTFTQAFTQFVNMGDPAGLRLAGSWTVSAWVNPTFVPVASSYFGLVAKADVSAHTNYALVLDNGPICGGGVAWAVYFNDTSGASYPTCYSATVSTGTWYLITGVWDSAAGKEYLYLNGNMVATTTPGGVPANGSGLSFMVGLDTCCGNYASATIDDVRVYNRALTPSEIANLYNGT